MAGIPNFANLQPEDFQNLHAQVQQLHAQLGLQAMSEVEVANLVQTGTTSLRTDISNLQSIVNNMAAQYTTMAAQYQQYLTATPQVIHVEANPARTHDKPYNKAIMDLKGFGRLEAFKGLGWLKWKNKFMTLVRLAYPDTGLECLGAAAKAKGEVGGDGELGYLDNVSADAVIQHAMGIDILATMGFILEGEPHDILSNVSGLPDANGFELWRRLELRYNNKSQSKTINEVTGVLSPEPARSFGEVLGHIERWEEKVGRLEAPNRINDTMKAALVTKLCPKKLRDHLELHLPGQREYHVIKAEIVRIIETGLLGKGDSSDKPSGMEIDPLTCGVDPSYGEYADNYMQNSAELAAIYKGGKGGKGGKWGGKGGAQQQNPWGGKGGKAPWKGGAGDGAKGWKGQEGGGKGGAGGVGGQGGGKGGKGEIPQFSTPFDGYCGYCNIYGHTAKYCLKKRKDEAAWYGGKGAHALEGMEEGGAEQGYDQPYVAVDDVKPLGGLGYQCGIIGTYNTHGRCCNGQEPCAHHLLYTGPTVQHRTPSPHTQAPTSATPPVHTPKPLPTHNRFSMLEETDEVALAKDLGRLAAITANTTPTSSIMGLGSTVNKKGLVKLKVMGDSGAADCVLPATLFNEVPINTTGAKVGRNYTAADGKHIANMGVRTLVGTTAEGSRRSIAFEVAEVTRPLASLSKIVKAGHRIVLEGSGGYIENTVSKERTAMYLENEVYVFDLYVDIPASQGFPRQGAKQ
jgi:hypothetical protein